MFNLFNKKEAPLLGLQGSGGGLGFLVGGGEPGVSGQTEYTTAGTYNWTAPADAEYYGISIVVVGGGGGSRMAKSGSQYGAGGGGGGLRWRNAYPVTAGQTYTVVVGSRGAGSDPNGGSNPTTDGGRSYFVSPSVLYADGGSGGGANQSPGGQGSVPSPLIGGGNGGAGADSDGSGGGHGGGGGAGGYTGNGGEAKSSPSDPTATPPGGGGGASFSGGGGVGIFGQGPDGTWEFGGGTGGSGGGTGGNYGDATNSAFGGAYGGGGGCHDNGAPSSVHNKLFGGPGAVRIIWGPEREFPNTGTGNNGDPAPA